MDTFWSLVLAAAMLAVGVFGGMLAGYGMYEYVGKRKLFEMSQKNEPINPKDLGVERRKEERKEGGLIPITVSAPEMDAAGVAVDGEEEKFFAELLDVSALGAGIFSQRFLATGVKILVGSKVKKPKFTKEAVVRSVVLNPKGLRIGVEFTEPLKGLEKELREREIKFRGY